jgi:hypothetical protein
MIISGVSVNAKVGCRMCEIYFREGVLECRSHHIHDFCP